MPTPSELPLPRLTRRAALTSVLAAAAVAGGCTADHVEPPVVAPETTPAGGVDLDPDVALAAEALTHEQGMLDVLRATIDRHGQLERLLRDAVATHEEHVRLLVKAVPAEARPSAVPEEATTASAPSPSAPSPSASSSGGADQSEKLSARARRQRRRVPDDVQRAVHRLARLEEQLGVDDRRTAFAAGSGSFARVLASMAGAAAQHAAVLRSRADGAGRSR